MEQYLVASSFRVLMGQAGIICGQETPLNRLCRILDIELPKDYDSAKSFSEKCISNLKSKADLLRKSHKSELKRTAALDIVSRMCFFKDFREFKLYAENFPNLPDDQKITSGNTFKICLSLLRVGDIQLDQFTNSIITGSATCISINSVDEITENLRLAKVIFSDDFLPNKYGPLLQAEFTSILNELYNHPLQHLLMTALSNPCIKNGSIQAWPDLSGLSVGMLLRKQLFFIDNRIMNEVSVNQFLVKKVLFAANDFAKNKAYLLNLECSSAQIKEDRKRIISSLSHPESKSEASKALEGLLKGFSSETVIDVLRKERGENGFIESGLIKNLPSGFVQDGSCIWKSSPSSRGFVFSVVRNKTSDRYLNDDSSVHEVLGIATNENGDIVGCCQITHANVKSGRLGDIVVAMAKSGNVDGLELATSLSLDSDSSSLDGYKNIVFVTKWETSIHFQRMGVGKELLSACFDHGLSGLASPEFVAARLEPRNFYAPPSNPKMDDMIPNYHLSKQNVVSAWNKATFDGTRFGNVHSEFKECYYLDHMHGNPKLRMMSLLTVPE